MFNSKKNKNVKVPDSQLSEDELFIRKLEQKKKRNKIIKICVGVVIVAIFLFIIFNLFFGSAVGTKFNYDGVYSTAPSKSLGKIENDSGMQLIAENEYLRMEFSPVDDLFIFTDIKSGKQFRSWPEPSSEETAEKGEDDKYTYPRYKVNHEIISSPIFVGHTNSGLDGGFILGINAFKSVEKKINKIENGIQFYYKINDLSMELYVEFVIEDNAIVMNFPIEGLKEKVAGKGENQDRMPRLASISGLTYLCNAQQGDNGYFVVPDGSGALTYFNHERVTSFDAYDKSIYGSDITFESLSSPDYNNVNLVMPMFGMVKDNVMIYSFATEGESSAAIQMGNPGLKGFNFYNINFSFQLRKFYYTKTTKNLSAFLQLETELSTKSVQQKIYIEVGEEGKNYSYVDLADRTRSYIKDVKWGNDKTIADKAPTMNVKIFLGAQNTTNSVLDKIKVMTTFEEVKEIYEALEAQGISDVKITLLGWQNDGYYGIATSKYPVDKEFGGKSDLKDLTEWAKEKGLMLSVENNMLLLYGNPTSGSSLRKSVIKEPGTSYLKFKMVSNAGVYRSGTSYYILGPAYYNKKFLSKDIKKLSDYGVENVDLLSVGDMLMTDYNKANATLREQVADLYVEWINKFGEEFDKVSVYYGNDYAVSAADYLLDTPLRTSTNMLLDEAIPFMQLVYHGMIDYYSEPINKADNMDEYRLKAIEYGSLLSYELTYNSTEQLKYTYYNTLFRSQYTDLLDMMKDSYQISESLKQLRDQRMTNHYRLIEGVEAFCTEYANGKKIYVNYEADSVSFDGIEIPSMSYVIA